MYQVLPCSQYEYATVFAVVDDDDNDVVEWEVFCAHYQMQQQPPLGAITGWKIVSKFPSGRNPSSKLHVSDGEIVGGCFEHEWMLSDLLELLRKSKFKFLSEWFMKLTKNQSEPSLEVFAKMYT